VSAPKALFAATWVHVFEEDGAEGEVFRPETGEVPLSRRPRQRVSFSRDGSARVVVSGPDDRLQEIEARWVEQDGEITVTTGATRATAKPLRFTVAAKDRLVRHKP
jgi:hypothetical protein